MATNLLRSKVVLVSRGEMTLQYSLVARDHGNISLDVLEGRSNQQLTGVDFSHVSQIGRVPSSHYIRINSNLMMETKNPYISSLM